MSSEELILVTGATGFLGVQLVRELLQRQPRAKLALLIRNPAGTGVAQVPQALAPNERPEDEPQPERHADEAHFLRALGRWSDVRDIGLGYGDVAAADSRANPAHYHST